MCDAAAFISYMYMNMYITYVSQMGMHSDHTYFRPDVQQSRSGTCMGTGMVLWLLRSRNQQELLASSEAQHQGKHIDPQFVYYLVISFRL